MRKILFFTGCLLFPEILFAHTTTETGGFAEGLLHPVLGFDHLLAMLSVGIVSAHIGGRAIWSLPLVFLTLMTLGALTGIYGMPIPPFAIEQGIAASVFTLGLVIAAGQKIPTIIISLCVGLFASFHGHAHGLEMPEYSLPATYILGFICGTAALHLFGVLVGVLSQKNNKAVLSLRLAGYGIAGVGSYALFLH